MVDRPQAEACPKPLLHTALPSTESGDAADQPTYDQVAALLPRLSELAGRLALTSPALTAGLLVTNIWRAGGGGGCGG
jgi:hypothetical protein